MLPDLSVFWVIFFVLVLTGVLNRLLLKPLQRVMGEREHAIRSARELAERSAAEARAAAAEFDAEDVRRPAPRFTARWTRCGRPRSASAPRFWRATRAEAEAEVARASASLKADAEEARRRLSADAEALGAAAADRILGRRAS